MSERSNNGPTRLMSAMLPTAAQKRRTREVRFMPGADTGPGIRFASSLERVLAVH